MDWKRYCRLARERAAQLARAGLSLLNQRMLKRSQRYLIVWTQRYPFGFFAIVAMVVVILWLLNPIYIRWLSGTVEKAGPLGDSFGALTSLFTGAAFVGLIATLMQQQREIRMQRQDLKLQRDEMKAARDELAGQKGQMELQNQSIKQQMFEQTFFNLLALFNRYIEGLAAKKDHPEKTPETGRTFLQDIKNQLQARFVSESYEMQIDSSSSSGAEFVKAYEHFKQRFYMNADELNGYLRQLHNVLQLIHNSSLDNREVYAGTLAAQLTDSELELIALCCARKEYAELKELVDEYQVLMKLPNPKNDIDIRRFCDEIAQREAQG
ncbi:putative phage abortive infection protein [Epibacterium ulvae]|uniref:putative phage abortive infection protein n=1 Tax=Epibacterium ulvae TaxID=1156985 RepID=UPI002492B723|nr:putative phage abortive infection protein [Epibacterium ulvae]